MKIALECKDIVLEQALRLFLREYLVLKKDCDFLICDAKLDIAKPQFIIAKHSPFLSVPFSKEELLKALNEFHTALRELAHKLVLDEKKRMKQEMKKIIIEFTKIYQNELAKLTLNLQNSLEKAIDERK